MPHINPIKTKYNRVEYNSRLEAYWAVFLDYHPLVLNYEYEPTTFRIDPGGYQYTPDFIYTIKSGTWLLEIKPEFPSVEFLVRYVSVAREHPFLLATGTFYKSTPVIYDLRAALYTLPEGGFSESSEEEIVSWAKGVKGSGVALEASQHILLAADVIAQVQKYRFDLPEQRPAHRSGSPENVKKHIERWRSQQNQIKRDTGEIKDEDVV